MCKYVGVWYEILDFYAMQAALTILAKEFQTLLVAWTLCRIPAKLNGFKENIGFGKFDQQYILFVLNLSWQTESSTSEVFEISLI